MDIKQSSVEWLFGQIPSFCKSSKGALDAFEQAKAMHKEEIENAYDDAIQDVRQDEERPLKGSEYYNIHFKKNG